MDINEQGVTHRYTISKKLKAEMEFQAASEEGVMAPVQVTDRRRVNVAGSST
jgi:hypothetical protein